MENKGITILGLNVYDRQKEAGEVQDVLTQYGCNIKMRLGLHDVTENYCSNSGIILLELAGDDDNKKQLEEKLSLIDGVDVQKMWFNSYQ